MSCRFAGCANPPALWEAVTCGKCMLSVPGPDVERPHGARSLFDRPYPTRIGQLGDLFSCVQAMQNFPRQINAGENQDLYFATQLAFDALGDASMRAHSRELIRGTVRLGYAPPFNASTVNWLQHTAFLDQTLDILRRFLPNAPESALDEVKARLVESLPTPNAASFLLGSGFRFVSWIARECAFAGAATILDAGNLSLAAALLEAVRDLRTGDADVSLAGAVTSPIGRSYLEGLSGITRFSSRPVLEPFSQDADGTIPGEGGAFFVLKRREDALRDHDRIYALVRAISIGHNPEGDGSRMIAQALQRTGIEPRTVGLVEADGSGVPEQEAREVAAIQKIWGEHRAGGPLVGIGSIKGNIGHTFKAAMAAGVVKTALALYRRVLPPQIMPERPLEALSNLSSSAYLLAEPRPWLVGDAAAPRRAVVTGDNFDPTESIGDASSGGRSAAIVLEEEPEPRRS